ncbi:hypothetical protein KSP39_PZI014714 [Platanthera zijinensis]|uniref:Peptidase S8/S53 domain-containing protein n=1 Tax=Platanthera zijinensis TaxID=2320716 RepID=A0AAP0B9M3_9ASPA
MITRTPTFIGLQPNAELWRQSNIGESVIIGVVDTGVDSTHSSFSDKGMSPPPIRWKSICQLPSGCYKKTNTRAGIL